MLERRDLYSLKEAQIVIEKWRVEYNTKRPHSALGYRPPAPAAYKPPESTKLNFTANDCDIKLSYFSWTKISTRSMRPSKFPEINYR